MRKICMTLAIFLVLLAVPLHMPTLVYAQQEAPAYAKWGRLAIKEVRTKYPHAKIVDYLHEGSEKDGESNIEKFKLWLKQGEREFGVYVRIKYNTKTNEVLNIELQETVS